MSITALLALVGIIVTIAAALGAAIPIFKKAATTSTIELLRNELAVEREARGAQEERYKKQISDQEERYKKLLADQEAKANDRIARLEGKVEFLTKDFAKVIAEEVKSVIGK